MLQRNLYLGWYLSTEDAEDKKITAYPSWRSVYRKWRGRRRGMEWSQIMKSPTDYSKESSWGWILNASYVSTSTAWKQILTSHSRINICVIIHTLLTLRHMTQRPSFTFYLEGIAIELILGYHYQLSYIYIKVFQAGLTAAIFWKVSQGSPLFKLSAKNIYFCTHLATWRLAAVKTHSLL